MKFSILAVSSFLFSLTSAAALAQTTLSYDERYDNAAFPMASTSCSDGENGLIRKGYTTMGSVPNFPNVGGAFAVEGWNSKNCGACFKVTYANSGKSIFVTAVDRANGFNIAKRAMDDLTDGMASQLGRIQVTWEKATPAQCKMG